MSWARDTIRGRIQKDAVEFVVWTDRIAVVLVGVPATNRLVTADVHLYYGGDPDVAADEACRFLAGKPCLMEACLEAGLDLWKRFGPEPDGEEFWRAMEGLGRAWSS